MHIVIAVIYIVSTFCFSVSLVLIPWQVLVDVTGEEFETLMDVLSKLKYTSTPDGAKEVVAIISEQAELSSEFQARLYPTPFVAFNYPTLLSSSKSNVCSFPSSTATRCRIHRSFHHLFQAGPQVL